MSWCSKSDYSDERATALTDQIVAAYEDGSPESIQVFDNLTTEALLHLSDDQYQALQEAIKQKGSE